MPIVSETNNNQDPDDAERHSHQRAKAPCCLLRLDGRSQTPLAQEIPDSCAEMKRGSQHANDEKHQVPGILHVLSNVRIRRPAVREPSLRVKMPANIRKRDDARVSLRCVQTIP